MAFLRDLASPTGERRVSTDESPPRLRESAQEALVVMVYLRAGEVVVGGGDLEASWLRREMSGRREE